MFAITASNLFPFRLALHCSLNVTAFPTVVKFSTKECSHCADTKWLMLDNGWARFCKAYKWTST